MANVTFSLRGGSLNAYRSFSGPSPENFNNSILISANTSPGVIGESVIDMETNGGVKYLNYPGQSNLPAGSPISVLFRAMFSDISDYQILFCLGDAWDLAGNGLGNGGLQMIAFLNDTLRVDGNGVQGAQCFTSEQGSFDVEANTIYDFFFSWDGTTNTNSANLFINGTNILSFTPGAEFAASGVRTANQFICIGANSGRFFSDLLLNEFVIWDDVVDPVALGLTGVSRTSFVACAALNALNNVDPGITNVASGTDYVIEGEALVGTLGPFGSTDPGVDNVAAGIGYNINGTALVGIRNVVTNVLQAAVLIGQSTAAILEAQ